MLTCCFLISFGTPAFAYDETTSTRPPNTAANCDPCHYPYPAGLTNGYAVHGGYTTTTRSCVKCHDVHVANPAGSMLLPAATIQATCFACHDGTGGRGVYGTIKARTGLNPGASHRCETTNAVPGGNFSTGTTATMTFGGINNSLTCSDCHSPHGANTVATFTAERSRDASETSVTARPATNNLLKQRPGNSASSTPVYGSDWCGACHRGRLSGGPAHNHPVDSTLVTTTPFYYERAAILSTDTSTSVTTLGTLGRTNRGYLMPYPRTTQQNGHNPICQQCHEDSRFVGALDPNGAPANAATFTVTKSDGNTDTVNPNNPRFQTFPHESVNERMLVEVDDDLCTNCHGTNLLP
jgi:predicted CXXCH cytochrome family protein